MVDKPEPQQSRIKRFLTPLTIAWIFVIVTLASTVAWITFSETPAELVEEPVIADDTPSPETEDNVSVTEVINDEETISEIEQPVLDTEPTTVDNPTSEPAVVDPTPNTNLANVIDTSDSQFPLSKAPNTNLLTDGKNGKIPALGPDGLIAWKEYARPYNGDEDTPRIAILVTDIGLSAKNSELAINNLPGQVDLAFSPYGRNLQEWLDKSREKGHEGFLMVPTEPLNYPENDPGPHTLIADYSSRDNLNRLDWVLSQVGGYVGLVNHMGSKFTASEEALNPIMEDIQKRGLMFVDARSTRFSMAARIARRMNIPRAMNDRYIDNVVSQDNIQKQLSELEKTANTFGAALGLARATPLTVKEVAAWSKTLSEKGIELVPVTAIANRQPIK